MGEDWCGEGLNNYFWLKQKKSVLATRDNTGFFERSDLLREIGRKVFLVL